MITTVLIIIAALVLDWLLGEPRRWHPLIGFGLLAQRLEKRFHRDAAGAYEQLLRGFTATLLLVAPFTLLGYLLSLNPLSDVLVSIMVLTLAIGHKSLHQHVEPIIAALSRHDDDTARALTGRIVSRDAETLNVPVAAIESVLENGNDSIFAALFWFAVAGIPGVVAYRLVNTLDAMWGYKSSRYLFFGRFAARLDDVLNYLPARLTALAYALLGKTRQALHCWQQQARHWSSPNAGPVMASGAGALGLILGGPARYDGDWHQRAELGCGHSPRAEDIARSLQLVRHTVLLWLLVLAVIAGVSHA